MSTPQHAIDALFTPHLQYGHERVVAQLLEAGVDKDRAMDGGATSLFAASQVSVLGWWLNQ